MDILNCDKEWIRTYKWQDYIVHLDLCEGILNILKSGADTIRKLEFLSDNCDALYRSAMYLIKHGYVRIKK